MSFPLCYCAITKFKKMTNYYFPTFLVPLLDKKLANNLNLVMI